MQRIFRKNVNIARHGKVSCRSTIQLWVYNFRTSASALRKKLPGGVGALRSPQNTEAVRQSFIRSPRRSARRYSVALGISDRSVMRILHRNLISVRTKWWCKGLSDHDMGNISIIAESLIGILSDDVLTTHEAHLRQQTEFSLLGRGRSIAAPSTASLQCTCGCLWWSGKLRSPRRWRAVTVTSARYVELRNFPTPELSRRGNELSTL
jgi:hypothetical protein